MKTTAIIFAAAGFIAHHLNSRAAGFTVVALVAVGLALPVCADLLEWLETARQGIAR